MYGAMLGCLLASVAGNSSQKAIIQDNKLHYAQIMAETCPSSALTGQTHSNKEYTGCTSTAIKSSASTLTITGCIFSSFTTSADGGVILAEASSLTLKITDCTFQSCKNSAMAGAVYIKQSSSSGSVSATISGTQFVQCEGSYGGAVASYLNNPTITITGGSFYKCSSTDCGGGCYFYTGKVTVKDVYVLDECTSAGAGGLISLIQASATFVIENCKVTKCNSTHDGSSEWGGGGVYAKACKVTVTNSSFTDCHTEAHGGAICVGPGTSTWNCFFTNCVAVDCTAKLTGGFMYHRRSTASETFDGVYCTRCTSEEEGSGQAIHFAFVGTWTYKNMCMMDCGSLPIYYEKEAIPEADLTAGCPEIPAQSPAPTAVVITPSYCFTAFSYVAVRPSYVQMSVFVWSVSSLGHIGL